MPLPWVDPTSYNPNFALSCLQLRCEKLDSSKSIRPPAMTLAAPCLPAVQESTVLPKQQVQAFGHLGQSYGPSGFRPFRPVREEPAKAEGDFEGPLKLLFQVCLLLNLPPDVGRPSELDCALLNARTVHYVPPDGMFRRPFMTCAKLYYCLHLSLPIILQKLPIHTAHILNSFKCR